MAQITAMEKNKELEIQDTVSDYYENIRYNRKYSKAYQLWWTRKMLSFIKPENLKGKILDNGCGIGSHFEELSKHSEFLVGLDMSEQMIHKARRRMDRSILGDSQRLPFGNEHFDLVFSRSLLHHLPDPESSISEIARVLKHNGEAVFSDTNSSILSSIPRKIAKKEGKHFSDSHKDFNDKELIRIIGSHLKIEKVYYFGYLAYPLLGFPDVTDVFRFFPCKNFLTSFLIKVDEALSEIPLVNNQGWGIIIKTAKKR